MKQLIKQLKKYSKAVSDYLKIKIEKFRDRSSGIIEKSKKLPQKTQNLILIILLICLFLSSLTLGGIIYLHYQINHPFSSTETPQIFVINSGETARDIAQSLEERGLINNNLYFVIYLKTLKGDNNKTPTIKAGKYLLSSNMNISQIAEKLINGLIISSEIKITIPEGYNIFQIGDKLEEVGLVNLKDFLSFSAEHTLNYNTENSDTQDNTESLVLVPCGQQVLCGSVASLEGWLFPDTYQFKKGESVEVIINKMLNNFEQKISSLDFSRSESSEKFPSVIARSISDEAISEQSGESLLNYPKQANLHKLIIIASFLEKEVINHYDRQVVAGIIEKRLSAGMPLQIDATVLYAQTLKKHGTDTEFNTETNDHNPVNLNDLEIDSPYNTYKYKGLSPGPICNPGIDAIKATLNPIKTDYWYYLSTKEGTTIFSKTYEEHLANKAKYLH